MADGVLDRTALRERTGGDVSLVSELTGLYTRDLPEWLRGLRDSIEAGDFEAVRRRGHRLRGTFGSLAAPAAMEAARTVEQAGASRDRELARAGLTRLEREAARVERELRDIESQSWG